jgi:EAL domain-containing protein (putative c-di-GMP-specific phosphodiesterase class I)
VKIDQSFVAGLPDRTATWPSCEAVVALAHSLRMAVVAEGVETEAQLQAVLQLGCDMVQGFHLARPMPAEQMASRLPRWQAATTPG